MPILGTGIVPAAPLGTEYQAITRRAFIPKLIVQSLYRATPVLSAAVANAQTATGGVSSITVPVQGAALTAAQWTDFGGNFNQPAELVGIQDAEFNLKAIVVPIPYFGMEGILQLNAAVIPKLEAKMNDAGNQVTNTLSNALWGNGIGGIQIDGFPGIINTSNIYGNIDRSQAANAFWRANVPTALVGTPLPTRISVLQYIVSAMKAAGGEIPNFGVCGPGTWHALASDFVSQEQYMVTPGSSFDQSTQGARAAFTALMVGSVPIFMDLTSPEGQFIFFNTRYYSFYIHEMAAFTFTGFASTLPNMQLGYIGALVAVLENVCVKPTSMTQIAGFGFNVV